MQLLTFKLPKIKYKQNVSYSAALAPFQALNIHVWLLATILDSTAIRSSIEQVYPNNLSMEVEVGWVVRRGTSGSGERRWVYLSLSISLLKESVCEFLNK